MKVFISWSGPRSMAVAKILASWFPQVMNEVETFVSDDDIDKGTAWNATITAALNESSFGVICVTPENDSSSWMLFEAGAISKQVGHNTSKVAPLLIGFGEGLLTPGHPLGGYQVTKPTREDMRKLVGSMNASLDNPRDAASLDRAFEVWWPEFEREFEKVPVPAGTTSPSAPTERELLQELAINVRNVTSMLERQQYHATGEADVVAPAWAGNPGDIYISAPGVRKMSDAEINGRRIVEDAAKRFGVRLESVRMKGSKSVQASVDAPTTDEDRQTLLEFQDYLAKRGISWALTLLE